MKAPRCPYCGCDDFEYDLSVDEPNDQGYYITCQECGREMFFWEHLEVTHWQIQDAKYSDNILDSSDSVDSRNRRARR